MSIDIKSTTQNSIAEMASAHASAAPMDKIWEQADRERAISDENLVVDIDGFEGPLDLLLHLARTQKVDIAKISVLALSEQYLDFIAKAQEIRLELAADYLVMAAWLAYLKSKLLIPQRADDEEPSGEEMALQLAFRLKRLEAMREAASRLINRNRLGRDVFARGEPETVLVYKKAEYSATLYDLLTAYAAQRQRQSITQVTIGKRKVWSLTDARGLLSKMLGFMDEWVSLDQFLLKYLKDPTERRTAIASSFAATLELVREGQLLIRQDKAFDPIYLRDGVRAE